MESRKHWLEAEVGLVFGRAAAGTKSPDAEAEIQKEFRQPASDPARGPRTHGKAAMGVKEENRARPAKRVLELLRPAKNS